MEREASNSLYTVEECEVWEGVDESDNTNTSDFNTSRSPLKRLEVEAMPRSSGNKNFVTPAIKRWYTLCGVCPEGIEFTQGEKQLALFCKVIGFVHTVIVNPVFCYCVLEGYGMDKPIKILLATIIFIQGLTFRNKVDLIISKSIDAKEVIRDPDDCKKLHALTKPFNVSLHILLLKVLVSPIYFLAYYPIYSLIFIQGKYIMAAICAVPLFTGFNNSAMMQHNPFSRTFLARKNEIEIKSYLGIIEDIVVSKKKVIDKENIIRLLREHQINFEYRMRERKKAYFYHPMNLFVGIVTTLSVLAILVMRSMTNDIPLEIATHLILLYSLFMGIFVATYIHGSQLALGPVTFGKASEKLKFVDFIKGVEENLSLRFETFDQYWLKEQKKVVTVHILGIRVDGELVKKIIFSLASLSCIAFIYVGRSLIFDSK